MNMRWMDAHCHLSDDAFESERADLYQELIGRDIHGLVLAGTDPVDWQKQSQLSPPLPLRIARVFGLHPWNVDSMNESELEAALITLQASLGSCQGLGEMGLDYFRAKTSAQREKHRFWFDRQLEVSRGKGLPLVLHVVKAHHEAVPQLKRHQKSYRGLVHSYWAHVDVAKSYIDMGFLLSVPPRIMKEDPHRILSSIDPDSIVFETDTPFINAAGECVKPTLIHDFLEFISDRRGEPLATTVDRQSRLLCDLFPVLKG